MTVLVLSIDFDGCLANSRFCESQDLDLVKANLPFLYHLQALQGAYVQTELLIGSSRQSSFIDFWSQKTNRQLLRCFPYYLEIADHLQCKFDGFLMADLYSNLAAGTAYQLELADTYPVRDKSDYSRHASELMAYLGEERRPPAPDAFCDSSKLSLLYAQMHRIASKYSDQMVVFKFFDDNLDYLNNIISTFSAFPQLLPGQLRLELCRYDGQVCTDVGNIQGAGDINMDYHASLIELKRKLKLPAWEHVKDLSAYFTKENMKPRKGVLNSTIDEDFLQLLMKLYRKAKNLERRQEPLAAASAFTLHRELTHGFYQYQNNTKTLQVFVHDSQAALALARPILEQHRGWKEVLYNLMAAILMFAGLGYLMVAAVRRDMLLFKVKTDTGKNLDELSQKLAQLH